MKKIINGKKYDTDTAECVGYWSNGYSGFQRAEERLFRKKTGEFFLHGEGGAMTIYSESYGNEISGGNEIIPLSEEEAREWAERNLDVEEYEAIFGEVEG